MQCHGVDPAQFPFFFKELEFGKIAGTSISLITR